MWAEVEDGYDVAGERLAAYLAEAAENDLALPHEVRVAQVIGTSSHVRDR